MIEKIKQYWQLVLIVATIVGWAGTYFTNKAKYEAKIEYLELEVAETKQESFDNRQLWKEQLAINQQNAVSIAQLTTIVEYLTDE